MLGALLMKVFGITSKSFVHLTALLLTCNLLSLLPLPLIGWVPDQSTEGIERLGDYQVVEMTDKVNNIESVGTSSPQMSTDRQQ